MKSIVPRFAGHNPTVQPKSSRPAPPLAYRPDFAGGIKPIAPASLGRVPAVQPKFRGPAATPPAYRPNFAVRAKSVASPPPAYRPDFSIQSKPIPSPPAGHLRVPHGLSAGRSAALQPSCAAGLCKWLGSLFKSTPAAAAAVPAPEPVPVVSLLPAWGAAVRVGYHWTAHWADIQRTGEFRPGGGLLGAGIYVCESDYSWVPGVYPALTTLFEVGYVGDTSRWSVLRIENMSGLRCRKEDEGSYDVVATVAKSGMQNQTCYKINGPNRIAAASFRVRRVET